MFKRLAGFLAIVVAVLAVGWLALKRADIPYASLEATYANEASQFVTLEDNVRVHFRDEGLIDGPTIVLVHGFSASLHTWEGWASDLKADYRVISLDLPAHGLTRSPEDYPASMDNFVKVIDGLTDYLGADSFALAGSSMGGNASWEFTLAHPEKVEALILVGASGWPETRDQQSSEPFIFRLLANPIARAALKDLDMTLLIRAGLKDSFVDETFVTDEMVKRYATLSRAPGRRAAILEMMSNDKARRYATSELMAAIDVPTLVLHGDQDNLVPVEGAKRFGESIEGSDVVIYEAIGHLPQEENTEQSLSHLRAFLAGLPEPSHLLENTADLATQVLPASTTE